MMQNFTIEHEFVDFIPRTLEDHKLYISVEFATASHKCFCGCGTEVVTPISPVGWQMTYDGETVSLSPSVGSWSLPCKSHYVIKRDKVMWAGTMSDKQIEAVKRRDRRDVERHFGVEPAVESTMDWEPADMSTAPASEPVTEESQKPSTGVVRRLLKWFAG